MNKIPVGSTFVRLTTISETYSQMCSSRKRRFVSCRCECGNILTVSVENLTTNHTQSCGCLHKEQTSQANGTHRMTGTPIYRAWRNMINRCKNTKVKCYKYYGGKGVTVFSDWLDFPTFQKWAIEAGYKDHLTIERLDNSIGYCPENCTWIPQSMQSRNRTTSIFLTLRGERKTIAEWGRDPRSKYKRSSIQARLKAGHSPESAVFG